jgi:hypothetical protein
LRAGITGVHHQACIIETSFLYMAYVFLHRDHLYILLDLTQNFFLPSFFPFSFFFFLLGIVINYILKKIKFQLFIASLGKHKK